MPIANGGSRLKERPLVSFLRKRDYRVLKELGQGACGKTVLLHDDLIDEYFVCKKYQPYSEAHRAELFQNFKREVKLLHQLHHTNVVRVFNYHLYPELFTGFILMEFVDGCDVDKFLERHPEKIDDCFVQTVSGFAYLESCGVLHRDIRAGNLMVTDDGIVKIIDLGFGKKIVAPDDFKKSISLNWHCSPPEEVLKSMYDFRTEIYFVGRLFEKLIADNCITDFKYDSLLS
jgi:serine/threonine-protein kinase